MFGTRFLQCCWVPEQRYRSTKERNKSQRIFHYNAQEIPGLTQVTCMCRQREEPLSVVTCTLKQNCHSHGQLLELLLSGTYTHDSLNHMCLLFVKGFIIRFDFWELLSYLLCNWYSRMKIPSWSETNILFYSAVWDLLTCVIEHIHVRVHVINQRLLFSSVNTSWLPTCVKPWGRLRWRVCRISRCPRCSVGHQQPSDSQYQ